MQPFVLTCTHCGAKYRVTAEEEIGKWIDCPKCSFPFMVHRPSDDDPVDETFADDDFRSHTDRDGAPSGPTGPRTTRNRTETEGNSSRVRTVLVILGAITLFGVRLALRINHAARRQNNPAPIQLPQNWPAFHRPNGFAEGLREMGPGRLGEEAAFLLPDTELISLTRPLAILRSPMFLDGSLEGSGVFANLELHGGTTAIETVSSTFARTHVTAQLVSAALRDDSFDADSVSDSALVVRTPWPFTPLEFGWQDSMAPRAMGRHTYFVDPQRNASDDQLSARVQVAPDLFLVANEARVQQILSGHRARELRDDFDFVEGDCHWLTAYRPRGLESLRSRFEGQPSPTGVLKVIFDYHEKGARAVALSITFDDDVDLRLSVLATDSAAAEAVRQAIDLEVAVALAEAEDADVDGQEKGGTSLAPSLRTVLSQVSGNVSVHSVTVPKSMIPLIFEMLQGVFPGAGHAMDEQNP